jgi:hypothetical protein
MDHDEKIRLKDRQLAALQRMFLRALADFESGQPDALDRAALIQAEREAATDDLLEIIGSEAMK